MENTIFDFLSNAFLGFSDMMFCNRKALKDTQNIVDIETLSLKSNQSLSEVAPNVIFDSVLSDNLNGSIPINYQVLHQATRHQNLSSRISYGRK